MRSKLLLALDKLLLLLVNKVLSGVEVDIAGRNTAALLDEDVAKDEDQVQGNTEVTRDKLGIIERLTGVNEDAKVLGESNETAEEQCTVAAVDTQRGTVGEDAAGDVLSATPLDEVDMGDEDRDPREQAEDSGEVDKVLEDIARVVADVHESQQREACADNKRRPRDTPLVGALEDGGSRAVASKTVQRTTGDVKIGVGGREDEDEDASVDNRRQRIDTCEFGSNNEGRSAGAWVLLVVCKGKRLGIIWHDHADEEDAQAVEEEDTVEGELDSLGDASAGVLRLASRHTHQLSTEIGECGVDHNRPEAQELAGRASVVKLSKGTWVAPVLESSGFSVGTAASRDDDTEEDDSDNDNNLDR